MNSIFGNSISMSEKSLDYLWQKQQVTLNNIANVDTPGYKKQVVSFEKEFQKQLETAVKSNDSSQIRETISNAKTKLNTTSTSDRLDENNVDMDMESVELSRTALQYQYMLDSVNNDISRLRTVIKG
ncbi:flagellar basal body rod protein FlgB [Parasporobacterium paucivorans]|uniref:Flagellar basal body rod protein FlgB n=1 Tax=Parasporobacterium paucivorans DSM 15970 TaxID=1122934 RepID=A0A1M6I789_9FIRM|nr:flagellar basal body rod protein FlgB [Parasporobacterium paucivorans]SHJ30319.1 flagellar basal-body rod protein FlgB [Parasporobacterium paucivorans DSM 15970]